MIFRADKCAVLALTDDALIADREEFLAIFVKPVFGKEHAIRVASIAAIPFGAALIANIHRLALDIATWNRANLSNARYFSVVAEANVAWILVRDSFAVRVELAIVSAAIAAIVLRTAFVFILYRLTDVLQRNAVDLPLFADAAMARLVVGDDVPVLVVRSVHGASARHVATLNSIVRAETVLAGIWLLDRLADLIVRSFVLATRQALAKNLPVRAVATFTFVLLRNLLAFLVMTSIMMASIAKILGTFNFTAQSSIVRASANSAIDFESLAILVKHAV